MKYLYVSSWKSTLNVLFCNVNLLLNSSIALIIKCFRNTECLLVHDVFSKVYLFITDCWNALNLLFTMLLKWVLMYSMVWFVFIVIN